MLFACFPLCSWSREHKPDHKLEHTKKAQTKAQKTPQKKAHTHSRTHSTNQSTNYISSSKLWLSCAFLMVKSTNQSTKKKKTHKQKHKLPNTEHKPEHKKSTNQSTRKSTNSQTQSTNQSTKKAQLFEQKSKFENLISEYEKSLKKALICAEKLTPFKMINWPASRPSALQAVRVSARALDQSLPS